MASIRKTLSCPVILCIVIQLTGRPTAGRGIHRVFLRSYLLLYILKVEREVFGTLKTPGELCARRHNLRKEMRRSVR